MVGGMVGGAAAGFVGGRGSAGGGARLSDQRGDVADAGAGGGSGDQKQSADYDREIAGAGGAAVRAGTALGVTADGQSEHHGGRRQSREPHRRGRTEQPGAFSASGGGSDGQPVDHRFRTHDEFAFQLGVCGESGRGQRSGHAGANRAGGGPGILSGVGDEGAGDRGAKDGGFAATFRAKDRGAGERQAEIRSGPELRESG